MLVTDEVTVGDAIDELAEKISELDDALEELDEDTDQAESLQSRRGRLSYLRNGLEWEVSDGDWTEETTIEIGALTAGEEAMMHREAPDQAVPKEMRLWFVAASVESAPFVGDDLEETFRGVSGLHPGAVEYLESKANGLATASDSSALTGGAEGNRSATSSSATVSKETSTSGPDSTT